MSASASESQISEREAVEILARLLHDVECAEMQQRTPEHTTRSVAFVLCQHPPAAVATFAERAFCWAYAARAALRAQLLVYSDPPPLELVQRLTHRELLEGYALCGTWSEEGRQPAGRVERLCAVRDLFGLFLQAARLRLAGAGRCPEDDREDLWHPEPIGWRAADRRALDFALGHDPRELRWTEAGKVAPDSR